MFRIPTSLENLGRAETTENSTFEIFLLLPSCEKDCWKYFTLERTAHKNSHSRAKSILKSNRKPMEAKSNALCNSNSGLHCASHYLQIDVR
ncbi:hypothetical protein NQ318_011921 [Aromia moschata]|uniref:C2H2-type domain-containing protein n=1 Tax=Aromia moschata TaxID=1265417 RepID=A0AAV8XHS3_9CUCU|nr:hypothetical protein NQ318_011921 [Aromia moschata]